LRSEVRPVPDRVSVVRTYLELRERGRFRPARIDDPELVLERVTEGAPALARRLYREVGGAFHWVDRLRWSDEMWEELFARPGYGLWVLRRMGEIAGYFELAGDTEGSVEIAYFGLRPGFVGKGLGAHLLTGAVEEAFRAGARRVWLHTCTLDHPAALPNYRKRGFEEFRRETYEAEI
jgi:ribosomal protein S18 acetylase RimI-like enzyme